MTGGRAETRAYQQCVARELLAPDAATKAKAAFRKNVYGLGGESLPAFVQKLLAAGQYAAAAKVVGAAEEADHLWGLAVKALPEAKGIGFVNLVVVLEVTVHLLFGQFGQCTTAARCFLEDVAEVVVLRGTALLTAAEVYGLAAQTNYGTSTVTPRRQAAAQSTAAGSYRPAGFAPARPAKRQKQPCRDFKSDKGCSWGASCKYAHV